MTTNRAAAKDDNALELWRRYGAREPHKVSETASNLTLVVTLQVALGVEGVSPCGSPSAGVVFMSGR